MNLSRRKKLTHLKNERMKLSAAKHAIGKSIFHHFPEWAACEKNVKTFLRTLNSIHQQLIRKCVSSNLQASLNSQNLSSAEPVFYFNISQTGGSCDRSLTNVFSVLNSNKSSSFLLCPLLYMSLPFDRKARVCEPSNQFACFV